jgi:phage tail P2-like protein
MAESLESLLPPPLLGDARFQALDQIASRLNEIDLSPLLVYLIDNVHASALPVLAEQFALMGEDGWSLAESDDARRALIKRAIELHRYKGTPWAVREVIRRLGFGEVDLIEGRLVRCRDGSATYNGDYVHGRSNAWAEYIVKLKQPITRDQAEKLQVVIERYAPARSLLIALDYTAVPIRHNGLATHNGRYNRGTFKT